MIGERWIEKQSDMGRVPKFQVVFQVLGKARRGALPGVGGDICLLQSCFFCTSHTRSCRGEGKQAGRQAGTGGWPNRAQPPTIDICVQNGRQQRGATPLPRRDTTHPLGSTELYLSYPASPTTPNSERSRRLEKRAEKPRLHPKSQ